VRDSKGAPLRLCTAAEWALACNVSGTGNWSYASQSGTYQPLQCNGADAQVGAPWPTGNSNNCYANDGNGPVFDLSANVAEWTSTPITYNGTTYYEVRGGSYLSPAPAMKCDFDFVIEQANYRAAELGFRCCANNAP
jgi:formylglycine-generating enzyme required for sulfatase activity